MNLDIHKSFLDIHKSFLDIYKSVEYWISINRFMDIQKWIMDIPNTNWFLDIHNSFQMNLGYP